MYLIKESQRDHTKDEGKRSNCVRSLCLSLLWLGLFDDWVVVRLVLVLEKFTNNQNPKKGKNIDCNQILRFTNYELNTNRSIKREENGINSKNGITSLILFPFLHPTAASKPHRSIPSI